MLVFSIWLSTHCKMLILPALFICNCNPPNGLDMKVADGRERNCCKSISCFCLCFWSEVYREGWRNSKAALQPRSKSQSSEFPSLLPVPDTSNSPAGILNAAFIPFVARGGESPISSGSICQGDSSADKNPHRDLEHLPVSKRLDILPDLNISRLSPRGEKASWLH